MHPQSLISTFVICLSGKYRSQTYSMQNLIFLLVSVAEQAEQTALNHTCRGVEIQ